MPDPAPSAAAAAHLPALRLKRNEDRRLNAGHLWVFSNEVDTGQTPLGKFIAGELVRVLAHNDRALGLAYVNPKSLICARLLETWRMPDASWFATRIRRALDLRRWVLAQQQQGDFSQGERRLAHDPQASQLDQALQGFRRAAEEAAARGPEFGAVVGDQPEAALESAQHDIALTRAG